LTSIISGLGGLITEYANNLLTRCKQRLTEKSDQLGNLERMINPLLDNDQVRYFVDIYSSKHLFDIYCLISGRTSVHPEPVFSQDEVNAGQLCFLKTCEQKTDKGLLSVH